MSVFEEGLDNLEATFINKKITVKYNDNQYKQWYKLLKELQDETYLDAIDAWCSSKNVLPAPADIIEMAGRNRVTVDNTVVIPKNTEHCDLCKNTGLISINYKHRELNAIYECVCCCICDAGNYCHSIYQLPQVNRDKLNLIQQAPNAPKTNLQNNVSRLVKQMSISDLKGV